MVYECDNSLTLGGYIGPKKGQIPHERDSAFFLTGTYKPQGWVVGTKCHCLKYLWKSQKNKKTVITGGTGILCHVATVMRAKMSYKFNFKNPQNSVQTGKTDKQKKVIIIFFDLCRK